MRGIIWCTFPGHFLIPRCFSQGARCTGQPPGRAGPEDSAQHIPCTPHLCSWLKAGKSQAEPQLGCSQQGQELAGTGLCHTCHTCLSLTSTRVLPTARPGAQNQGSKTAGLGPTAMKWPLLVLETLKPSEIKCCTLLLREKAAFLLESSSSSPPGREQHLWLCCSGLGRTFLPGVTSEHSTSTGLGSSANIPAGRSLNSSP